MWSAACRSSCKQLTDMIRLGQALEIRALSIFMACCSCKPDFYIQIMFFAGFMLYTIAAIAATLFLIFYLAPSYGMTTIFVYVGICSLVGSLSVMSCKVRDILAVRA
ncbi:MAG: hypothetical protein EOO81_09380, partial [Oxalobacteraceae bacterium]